MVKVPTYERTERLRPAFRQDIDVRATPGAFGAGVGAGLQKLGQGVEQVGEVVQKIQAFDDENAAKDTDNAFANWARGKMYGEGGYLTLEGRNAVEGRAKFEEEAEAKRKELGAALRPGAARMFDLASSARMLSMSQQAIVHQASERKEWMRETSGARVTGFANDALAGYNKPEVVQKNIAAGLLELDSRGQLEGWAKEELDRQKSIYTSGVHGGVATRMIEENPLAADKYLKDNAGAFLPADLVKLQSQLEAPLRAARTDQWLQQAIGGLSPTADFAAPQTGGMLGAMLPITVKSESNGDPNAVSPKGATGLMQVMPGTMTDPGFGIRPSNGTAADTVRVGQEYLQKMMERYGNDPAKAWAAYNAGPGALDKVIAAKGSNWLSSMPKETRDYVSKNMAALGAGGEGGNAPGGTAWLGELYRKAEAIPDLEDREAAFTAIDKWFNRQQRVLGASREQVVDDIEKRMIADPSFDPSTLPVATQQVIGLAGMNAFKNTYEARLARGKIVTDPVVMDELLQEQAFDPEGFAKKDLAPYRSRLSDSDYLELRGKQRAAVADTTKAMREGSIYRDAFTIGKEFYGAAGIATGSGSSARSEANKTKEAQFNGALRQEVDEFIQREKRKPSYDEMRTIASALTLSVIGSEARSAWSPGRLFDDDQDDVYTGKVYQRDAMPEGLNKRLNPSYANVPADWINPIRQTLTKRLRRAPTNAEIAQEWGNIAVQMIGGM